MNRQVAGAALTIFAGIFWGFSGSVGQYLFNYQGMNSMWLVPVRLAVAGGLLFVYCLAAYGPGEVFAPWKSRADALELIVYGVPGVAFSQYFYFYTIQRSTAGVGAILQDLAPVMILLYSCFAARRRPHLYEIVSIALALGGVVLLTTHGDLNNIVIPTAALISGILCAVSVSIYNIVPARILGRHHVMILQMWAFILGGVVMAVMFRPWRFDYVPNAAGIAGILFVAVGGCIVAFTCYLVGLRYIGPEKAVLYGFTEPVTAVIVSTFVFGDPFTVMDGIGFLMVFLMMVLISYGMKIENKAAARVKSAAGAVDLPPEN